jgi:hypothetical protein
MAWGTVLVIFCVQHQALPPFTYPPHHVALDEDFAPARLCAPSVLFVDPVSPLGQTVARKLGVPLQPGPRVPFCVVGRGARIVVRPRAGLAGTLEQRVGAVLTDVWCGRYEARGIVRASGPAMASIAHWRQRYVHALRFGGGGDASRHDALEREHAHKSRHLTHVSRHAAYHAAGFLLRGARVGKILRRQGHPRRRKARVLWMPRFNKAAFVARDGKGRRLVSRRTAREAVGAGYAAVRRCAVQVAPRSPAHTRHGRHRVPHLQHVRVWFCRDARQHPAYVQLCGVWREGSA